MAELLTKVLAELQWIKSILVSPVAVVSINELRRCLEFRYLPMAD